MTDTDYIEIDSDGVLRLFEALSYKEQKKTYKQALRKSANLIAKETRKNLKHKMGQSATHSGKYPPMSKGIKVTVFRNGKQAKVHIMKDFRLKWFEKGTKDRYNKKTGRYTGRIKPLYFFKAARQSKSNEARDSILQNLRESILKIYAKHDSRNR